MINLSVGLSGHHSSGSVHIGSGHHSGAGLYRSGYHGPRPYHGHHYDTWYGSYRPMYYPFSTYYRPGGYDRGYYSYSSLYGYVPSVYRSYNTDVYYVDGGAGLTYVEPDIYAATLGTELEVVPGPLAVDEAYGAAIGPDGGAVDPASLPALEDSPTILRGNEAFLAGQYDEARRWYVRAVLAHRGNGYAAVLYGLAYFATGDFEVAAAAIRQGLTDTPELMDHPIDLRRLYRDDAALRMHLERLASSLSRTARADSLFALPDGALLLGYLYISAGQLERGLAVLDRALEVDYPDALVLRVRDAAIRALRERSVER